MSIKSFLSLIVIFFISTQAWTQDTSYVFSKLYDTEATVVKNQSQSGTCWSFATVSFLESEIIRMGGDHIDLSEMFFVYQAYLDKAEMMQRYRGRSNFSPGGQAHDVMNTIRINGLMPESAFSGLKCYDIHNHGEMDAALRGLASGLTKRKDAAEQLIPSTAAVLGVYIGTPPETFDVNGTSYEPVSYNKAITQINPDDYIELTSYSHHPFYQSFVLEVPDNWSFDSYYNVPLDDLIEVMESALKGGYSLCWDGDVSDRGFSHQNALAIVPEADGKVCFGHPRPEREIGQLERQEAFDSFDATDDHLMHITAMVQDQNGVHYFVTKNSWGPDRNENGGYLNMSESFIRLNTVAIMVHKDAIPKHIRKNLGL